MTVVYVDVLLVLNFMVNMVLIRAASLFAGRSFHVGRGALGAAVGAISSLIIFLPFYGVVAMGGCKLIFCVAMVFIAFGYRDVHGLLRDIFCLFTVSFLFSGTMLAIYISLSPLGMTVYNGVLYFDISAVALIAVTVVCYVITSVLAALLHRKAPLGSRCKVIIHHQGRTVELPAIIDTGNSLTEPFSGKAAMLCGEKDVAILLPKGFCGMSMGTLDALSMGLRMVPFKSVGGSGALPAFSPESIIIETETGRYEAEEGCYLAVSSQTIGTSEYCGIVNPAMVKKEMSVAGGSGK